MLPAALAILILGQQAPLPPEVATPGWAVSPLPPEVASAGWGAEAPVASPGPAVRVPESLRAQIRAKLAGKARPTPPPTPPARPPEPPKLRAIDGQWYTNPDPARLARDVEAIDAALRARAATATYYPVPAYYQPPAYPAPAANYGFGGGSRGGGAYCAPGGT